MKEFFASKWVVRAVTAVSATVLVVGVATFVATRPDPSPATNTVPIDPDYVVPEPKQAKLTQVPKAARKVAGEFILAATGREDMEKAWRITHADLKQGISKKEWLTGNIPVQYYPPNDIETASFSVDQVSAREVFLKVLVLPKKSSNVKPQVFAIGLRAAGKGAAKSWLVHYWAPVANIPVPAIPEG